MKLTMFAFFNAYLGCYDQPVFAKESIENVVESYRRSILSNPDQAYQGKFNEKELVELGSFDDFEGKFELIEPRKILHFAKCFPPGYLKKKEAIDA